LIAIIRKPTEAGLSHSQPPISATSSLESAVGS
jgi:hypothetical protein